MRRACVASVVPPATPEARGRGRAKPVLQGRGGKHDALDARRRVWHPPHVPRPQTVTQTSIRHSYPLRTWKRRKTRRRRGSHAWTPQTPMMWRSRAWSSRRSYAAAVLTSDTECCRAVAPLSNCRVVTASSSASAENLCLLGVELCVRDHALRFQVGQFGQFVGATTSPGRVTHEGIKCLVLLCRLALGALMHTAAAGDQVDEASEEREDDNEVDPQRLGRTTHVVAAEDVSEDP